jgi:hypothetical protein
MVSIGVVKSEKISQLTGKTLYVPKAAYRLTSSIPVIIFIINPLLFF